MPENICESCNQSNRNRSQKSGLNPAARTLPPIHSPKEYVVDLFAYEGSQAKELAVDPMQNSFEAVALTWIFTVK